MKNWWKYFKTEFLSRICSSKKRIIKFIAICLIPFLYGFICIWAFWNPIKNVGKAPMAIVDQSKPVSLVIASSQKQSNNFALNDSNNNDDIVARIDENRAIQNYAGLNIGVITYYVALNSDGALYGNVYNASELIKNNNLNALDQCASQSASGQVAIFTYSQTYKYGDKTPSLTELAKIKDFIKYQKNSKEVTVYPNFSIVRDYFNWWKKNPGPQNIIQYNSNTEKFEIILQSKREWNAEEQTYELIPEQSLQNVRYLDGEEADKMANFIPSENQNCPGKWEVTNDKYWLQVQISQNFNANAISVINSYLENNITLSDYFITQLKNAPVNIWTTFKQNFLFGQFMKISSEFKSAILLNMVPNIISQTISTAIENILNENVDNNELKYYFKGTNNNLIVNNTDLTLNNNDNYAVYNSDILTSIKSNQQNINNFPDLKHLTNTIVGDTNSFTKSVADKYNNFINKNNVWKSIANFIINNLIISNVYDEPVVLSNEQLRQLFGTSNGIQSMLELDSNMMKSLTGLSETRVQIKGTSANIPWNEFCDSFIEDLKKNVGLIPLFNKNSTIISQREINKNLGKNIGAWMGFLTVGENKIKNIDDIVTNNIQGSQYAVYGIGLGEFFAGIGIWVGILMQTFVFDRNIRRPKNETWKIGYHGKNDCKNNRLARFQDATSWWFAKNTLMSFTTIIQVTFLLITLGMLGWFQIGSSFGLLYLAILFSALIWTTFIQSLWFLFRDEVVGKFIVILFLIVNLTSGWGTFPPVMQYKFFDVLSNIAPFTYFIHNQSTIIYGISVQGINTIDTLSVLKNCGIQLIYLLIAICLALYEGLNLQKITFFGSSNSKKIAIALKQLGYNDEKYFVVKNKHNKEITKINWDNFDWTYHEDIVQETVALFPPINDFKFYKLKHNCDTFAIKE